MNDDARSKPALMLEAFLPYRLAVLAHTTSRALAGVYAERFGLSIPEWRILPTSAVWSAYAGELAERSQPGQAQGHARAPASVEAAG